MTDFTRLGRELRAELRQPPADWTKQQSVRLRGLDLGRRESRFSPVALAAAIALSVCTAFGVYYLAKPGDDDFAALKPSLVAQPPADVDTTKAIWLGADSTPTTHRLADSSQIQLNEGARGRLDEGLASGTRFDLHEGTASFFIADQKGAEFSVLAGDYRVVVVGTRFTVGYVPPRQLSVAVEEGRVSVVLPERVQPVFVSAGEHLKISGNDFSLQAADSSTKADSANPDATGSETSADLAKEVSNLAWKAPYHAGKYDAACAALQGKPLIALQKQLSAADMIELSSALRLCGRIYDALGALATLRQRFPASSQAKDALFLLGRIHATSGNPELAISHLKQYVVLNDRARFAPEALGRLIELHVARGQKEEARSYAQKYLAIAPQGAYRQLAQSVTEKR